MARKYDANTYTDDTGKLLRAIPANRKVRVTEQPGRLKNCFRDRLRD